MRWTKVHGGQVLVLPSDSIKQNYIMYHLHMVAKPRAKIVTFHPLSLPTLLFLPRLLLPLLLPLTSAPLACSLFFSRPFPYVLSYYYYYYYYYYEESWQRTESTGRLKTDRMDDTSKTQKENESYGKWHNEEVSTNSKHHYGLKYMRGWHN